MNLDAQQQQFLDDEFFSLVLQATTQHSPTYEEDATPDQRRAFAQALREKLEGIAAAYHERGHNNRAPSEEHTKAINDLADALSAKFSSYLYERKFRIGSAQKAVNLYLKYLWCRGRMQVPPPHCPFDGFVIKKLGLQGKVNWTELKFVSDYKNLVNGAEKAASESGFDSIATWELHIYNEAQTMERERVAKSFVAKRRKKRFP